MKKTKAIRYIQNGRVFYSVVLPASEAVELTQVDVWDPDNPDSGYQRAPSEARKRSIGQYILEPNSILPIGGLVNARPQSPNGADETTYGSVLKFEKLAGDENFAF